VIHGFGYRIFGKGIRADFKKRQKVSENEWKGRGKKLIILNNIKASPHSHFLIVFLFLFFLLIL
jgi:hypothetical protein